VNSSDCFLDGVPGDRGRLGGAARKVQLLIALVLAALVTIAAASAVAAPADKRELQAREAFAAGRYNDALDLYAKLYAEKLHPTYLRNVGRCYQNLGDPDHAISSFREYLRQAKDVTPTERAQVEGYIAEMEVLKRQREAAADATKAAKPIATTPLPPPTAATAAPAPSVLLTQPPPPPPAESPPFYKRGVFWGVVAGAVVLGTVGILAGTGAFSSSKDAVCPAGVTCL
jgi:hypothetical protein